MGLLRHIVVLTATIDPSVGNITVALNDKHERLRQYLENIRNLILKTDVTHIIFCENSNYTHDFSDLISLANDHCKFLEIISFTGTNEIIKDKGKSFGEAEILNFAVDNSAYLQDDNVTFYKLTGRIFVENINKILIENCCDNIFIRWDVKKKEVDTRFFKVQTGFYKKNLYRLLDQMNESCGLSIEEVYFNHLKGKTSIHSFQSYPEIKGICASLGKPYDLGLLKSIYRKLQLKAGLLDLRRCS